jgi:hypothetical protein
MAGILQIWQDSRDGTLHLSYEVPREDSILGLAYFPHICIKIPRITFP